MRVRKSKILISLVILLVFLMVLAAGCGGGDDRSGGETQGSGNTNGNTKKGKTAKEVTTVKGTLGRVDLEKKRITLRPEGGGEPLRLRFNPEVANVTVAGEEANADTLESRQRAEVQYFERNGRKIARNVNVTSDAPPQDAQSGGATN